MRLPVLGAALLASLVVASSAWGKGCVRIEVASTTRAGEPVLVRVHTYMAKVVHGQVVPANATPIPVPRFTMTAERPDGRQLRFGTTMTGQTRVARITFGMVGVWRLWASNWEYAPPSCAPPARVQVRPSAR